MSKKSKKQETSIATIPALNLDFDKAGAITILKDGGWSTSNPSPSLLLNGLNPTHTGLPVSHYSSLASASVYCAVRTLSEDVACLPILMQKKLATGGFVSTESHPLVDLFDEPNEWQTSFDFISFIVMSLSLRGNAFVFVGRNGKGEPNMLLPISPDMVSVYVSAINGVITYTLTHKLLGGSKMGVPAEDVIHIKNLSVSDGVMGISPISASQDVFSLSLQTQIHAARIFAQGTTVSGVLQYPGKLSTETRKNLAQQWQERHSSVQNAGKTPVLEEGMEFKPFDISPKDQQLLEARSFTVEEIARMFNIPPHKIGGMNRVSYSSLESQQQAYVDSSLTPITTKIEKAFERRLLFSDERKRFKIKFDFMNLLKGDTKARFDAYQVALLNGIYNVDEVRGREGLPPLPDGKGVEHRFPLNQSPDSKPTPTSPNSGTPAADTAADDDATQQDAE
jgi:HK97 family phage portal protein